MQSKAGEDSSSESNVLDDWEQLDDENLLEGQLKCLVVNNEEEKIASRLNGSRSVPIIVDPDYQFKYKTPEPTIKILKRPNSSTTLSGMANGKPKPASKTLEEAKEVSINFQKEAEYDRARQRILGASVECSPSGNAPASDKTYSRVEILKTAANGVTVTRNPRMPDGTSGFQKNRST